VIKIEKCIKCGFELTKVEKWEHYYCNYYCCSPCCPDTNISPCHKEIIEKAEREMRKHLKKKGII
jgi:hypothetical protein